MTFNLFVQHARPRDAFPVLISLLLLHAAPNNLARKCTSLTPINPIKSAPVCCKLTVISVFTVSRPKFHRVQCKFEDPFSAGRLASSPLSTHCVCRHYWSAHAQKFAAPRVLSFGCCRRKNGYLLNIWRPIVHALFHWPHPGFYRHVCMDRLYKRSIFQFNRMKNRRVIRGQSLRHSPPTLDCKFEPNVTFTEMKGLDQGLPGDKLPKFLIAPFSSYGLWKLIFANVWHLITY